LGFTVFFGDWFMSWVERSLDELGFVSRGKSKHRPRDAEHLYGGPYPFVQTGDIKHSGLYLTRYTQTYSDAGLAQSKLWPEGTLCITIAANIADTAILAIDACFPDSVIGFIPETDKADVRFIKYMFDAHLKLRYQQFTQGAAQDNLSQKKLLSLKFPVPDIFIQKKIADIISSYDDLIENNRRRIQLLEESARLLYKEWFVHLRFPGHEHTKITDGVPEGWEKKTLDSIADINKKSLQSNFQGEIEYLDISSVSLGRVVGSSIINFIDAPSRARRVVAHGDIIWSCVRPNLKSYSLVWRPNNNMIVSTGFAVISPRHPYLIPFIYFFMTSQEYVEYLSNVATGVAYPAVKPTDFKKSVMLVPTESLIRNYSDSCIPIFDLIYCLQQQTKKLAQARDLLLPKLMNGEIEV
jgi:type I restriction enzyme S subunit